MSKVALLPKYPDRICWGCPRYCSVSHLACRETRVPHPRELFGDDWFELEQEPELITLAHQTAFTSPGISDSDMD